MKSKAQKQEELNKGKKLLAQSRILVFSDITKIPAENLRGLRRQSRSEGGELLVIKKRLLNLLLKEAGADLDARRFGMSIATVFSEEDLEKISAAVCNFFASLGDTAKAKKEFLQKILGAYDLKEKNFIEPEKVLFLGQLPPREVLLAQLVGMIAAPLRAFMYVLQERAKKMSS